MTKCNTLNICTPSDANQPLKTRARDHILDQIRTGRLLPGQHVPSVRRLAKLLNLSTNIAFLAIKELHQEKILERLPNGRYQVGNELSRLSPQKKLRLAFTNTGDERIHHSVYQNAYNRLAQLVSTKNKITLDCHLDLHDTWSHLPDGYYDLLIVGDWKPPQSRRICKGICIGIDTWKTTEVDCVIKPDHHKGGELAGRFLRESGRKKIVYFDDRTDEPFVLQAMVHRRLGLYKGWIDAGGDLEDIIHVQCGPFFDELKRYVVEYSKKADAFFGYCDAFALQLWTFLSEMGVRVPDDLALMGYDGSYEALKHDPPLATIKLPYCQVAEKIFDIVTSGPPDFSYLKGQEILIPPQLFEGESV
ncbi:MAG: substrate-binding domain-containing protein [Phycisphaerae bacterium]|jgi:DNA-binding transcriptional regulator YhcF (GntR family)|nr:substrate-binding domain-containing protein [Phycisphaerae bacterium]